MTTYNSVDEANEAIAQKIIAAQPMLVDVLTYRSWSPLTQSVRYAVVIPEASTKMATYTQSRTGS